MSDSELSDLEPEYDDGDEVMQPSSDDDDEDVEMDQGMMSEGDDNGSERGIPRRTSPNHSDVST
jgi:hypothetical protein